MADNELSGRVPSELGLMTALNILDLGGNALLTGSIPSTLCGIDFVRADCNICNDEDTPSGCCTETFPEVCPSAAPTSD